MGDYSVYWPKAIILRPPRHSVQPAVTAGGRRRPEAIWMWKPQENEKQERDSTVYYNEKIQEREGIYSKGSDTQ